MVKVDLLKVNTNPPQQKRKEKKKKKKKVSHLYISDDIFNRLPVFTYFSGGLNILNN